MELKLPKLRKIDPNKPKKKKILLLSDDLRLFSGIFRVHIRPSLIVEKMSNRYWNHLDNDFQMLNQKYGKMTFNEEKKGRDSSDDDLDCGDERNRAKDFHNHYSS